MEAGCRLPKGYRFRFGQRFGWVLEEVQGFGQVLDGLGCAVGSGKGKVTPPRKVG